MVVGQLDRALTADLAHLVSDANRTERARHNTRRTRRHRYHRCAVRSGRRNFREHQGGRASSQCPVDQSAIGDTSPVRRIGPCPFRYDRRPRIGGATSSQCSVGVVKILRVLVSPLSSFGNLRVRGVGTDTGQPRRAAAGDHPCRGTAGAPRLCRRSACRMDKGRAPS
jgi:hypothetical protein